MTRDDAAVFLLDTFGSPEPAAKDLVLRAEAQLRGFVYVKPHLRTWPIHRKPARSRFTYRPILIRNVEVI
jgi:hypothetical protein